MKQIFGLTRDWPGALIACLALVLQSLASAAEQPATANPALTGDKAIEHLKTTGQYESLSEAITAARYAVRTLEPRSSRGDEAQTSSTQPSTLNSQPTATAANPAHGIFSSFTPEGLRLRVRTGNSTNAPMVTSDWRLESLGYGEAQVAVPAGELKVTGQRAEIIRGGPANSKSAIQNPRVIEWFVNTPGGLEHGFTLHERPASQLSTFNSQLPLRLVIAVTGDLTPETDAAGQRLELRDAAGRTVLSYEKLKVWDATGAALAAKMAITEGRVTLSVNDSTARYPLTIDPTFTQQAYIKASNTGVADRFGSSVAISGDTVVVGAPYEDSNATGGDGNQSNNSAGSAGAAYVFVRTGTTWSQQAYLKASNTDAYDEFGVSVAISGDTVVIGARFEDSNATGVNGNQSDNSAPVSGAAYVFVRSGSPVVWSQQAYLKASNTDAYDEFGVSVAISGDTVVVGAIFEDSNATGVNGNQNDSGPYAGAAYVFERSGSPAAWSQQAYLKASNTDADDFFGVSVAIAGDTVVVGAINEDSNATGVDGNQSDNSAGSAGAAYVFVRSGSPVAWSQQAYLKASNTDPSDRFGWSVAISGDTVVVGAHGEDSNATGVNGNQSDNSAIQSGAAYVFVRSGSPVAWSQQAYLKASNTDADDLFGVGVAISDDTVVVGAHGEDSNATGVNGHQSNDSAPFSGAAYLFHVHPAGRISTAVTPPGPIQVGDTFTVTFSISGYLAATEIDAVNFKAVFPGAMFTLVPGSVSFHDAFGPDANWLRLAPQDGVGAGALPLTGLTFPGPGILEIFLSDSRPASTRGTLAESGFLVSFQLHANAAGTGEIWPSASSVGTVLFGVGHTPAGVPVFSGASMEVFPATPGRITGRVDMVGETEVPIPRSLLVPTTRVRAQNGPPGSDREVSLPPPDYSGDFTLDGLAHSDSVLPQRRYEVGAAMNFRTGRRLETFTSPFLGQGLNLAQSVTVPAGGTVNLGDTFVMNPGFVNGRLFLQGPTESLLGHPSTLRYIARLVDFDPDADGLPNINPDGDSRVSAAGRGDLKSAGAAYSAAGAKAFVSFEGEFNPITSAFLGDYDLVLAGLNGQASYWHELGLQLLLEAGFPETPETYVRQKLRITEERNPQYNNIAGIEVRPAEHTTVNLNYCLSEVVIEVETDTGTLWNPTVTATVACTWRPQDRISRATFGRTG